MTTSAIGAGRTRRSWLATTMADAAAVSSAIARIRSSGSCPINGEDDFSTARVTRAVVHSRRHECCIPFVVGKTSCGHSKKYRPALSLQDPEIRGMGESLALLTRSTLWMHRGGGAIVATLPCVSAARPKGRHAPSFKHDWLGMIASNRSFHNLWNHAV